MNETIKELRKWIIYMYTFPNGKRYIGKTCHSLYERQDGSDWNGYKTCPLVYNAIKKYGIENIQQNILFEDYMDDQCAGRLESICIALFKTNYNRYNNPSYGYNLTDGGDGSVGPRPQVRGEKHHNSKPIYCIELDRVFVNARRAEVEIEVSFGSISNCCIGKSKTTLGGNTGFERLHWLFQEDVSAEKIKEVMSRPLVESNKGKSVYCIELDKHFVSAKEAEAAGYGSAASIRQCCVGRCAFVGYFGKKLHWLYSEDVDEQNIKNKLSIDKGGHTKVLVYCIELDMVFASIKDAERFIGVRGIKRVLDNPQYTSGVDPISGVQLHWTTATEEQIFQFLQNKMIN